MFPESANHEIPEIIATFNRTSIAEPPQPADWREAAMHKMLRVHDTRTAHLVRDIRLHAGHSNQSVLLLGCERNRLIRFLQECCQAKSLLPGSYHWANEEEDTSGC